MQEKKHLCSKVFLICVSICAVLSSFPSLLLQILIYNFKSDKASWWLPLFNLDQELSIPSIFSVRLFWICGILTYSISRIKKNLKDSTYKYWVYMSFIFIILGFDEGSSIHEKTVIPIKMLIGVDLPDYLKFAWVIPATIIVILLSLMFKKFIFALPQKTRKLLFLSLFLYLSGALFLEMFGSYFSSNYGIKNLTYNIIVTIEEILEIFGLIIASYSFIDYLEREHPKIIFKLD
ncbi:MAG: hypothetical protein GYA51_11055 [Candidatus Methanofastidiosa archaeon]|nr:hypothetical protein [Candidatus Methanofastidiosa archaeon]